MFRVPVQQVVAQGRALHGCLKIRYQSHCVRAHKGLQWTRLGAADDCWSHAFCVHTGWLWHDLQLGPGLLGDHAEPESVRMWFTAGALQGLTEQLHAGGVAEQVAPTLPRGLAETCYCSSTGTAAIAAACRAVGHHLHTDMPILPQNTTLAARGPYLVACPSSPPGPLRRGTAAGTRPRSCGTRCSCPRCCSAPPPGSGSAHIPPDESRAHFALL